MNWDQVEGQWKSLKGSIRDKWGKLTDQDYESIAGKKDRFLGKLQERYGFAKERAESDLNQFFSNINTDTTAPSNRNKKSNDPSSIDMNIEVKKGPSVH